MEEIVRRYFERDLIERSFRALKSVLGLGPLRHWLENKINNHIYVCYISYLLLMLLQRKLKEKDLTIFKALDELKYVYKVSTKEGVEKIVATTKTQKKILKLMGIKM
jgi:transposase